MTLDAALDVLGEHGPLAAISLALIYLVWTMIKAQNATTKERVEATKEIADAMKANALAQQDTAHAFKDMSESMKTLEGVVRTQTGGQVATNNYVRERLEEMKANVAVLMDRISK